MDIFSSTTSASLKPNIFSAAALNDNIVPCSSMTIIASGTVARIERKCASPSVLDGVELSERTIAAVLSAHSENATLYSAWSAQLRHARDAEWQFAAAGVRHDNLLTNPKGL